MKVLLIIRGKSLKGGGGAERRFIRLLNYLNNPNIRLLTNKEFAESMLETDLLINANLIVHPPQEMSIFSFNLWLMKTIKTLKIDVIHLVLIQKSLLPFYFWLNFFNQRTRVVSTIAWSKYLDEGSPRLVDIILGNCIWRRSSLIDLLYPSGIRSKWLKRYIRKINITPCSFTDYELFKPAVRKENIVSFVGRLIPEKNPILFLETILRIKSLYPEAILNWKFVIVGKGKLEKKMRGFINKYSLNEIVELSSVHSSHELLSKSKIFVSLQYPTNYPSQSLIEAMATENSVICTDDEDTRLLINSTNGILIPMDANKLMEALNILIDNDILRANLGRKAREKVLKEHRLDIFASYMMNLWSKAISYEKLY